MVICKYKKIKCFNKINSGNRKPRTKSQINSAIRRMLFDNPLKKPLNRINQSQRMYGNQLWKKRKLRDRTATILLDGVLKGKVKIT